ncbi:hypothetical protein B0H17DRAFT_1204021 [Mycena rosella]|uniref:Uncharacterized protein n=1 Tax=Mycena rosella TaxID=1033263 RepID=A0AAD7DBX3_MYCRO|nr:hypothetical protein B0H17DRAFT_1204021 [Mycena rosella]
MPHQSDLDVDAQLAAAMAAESPLPPTPLGRNPLKRPRTNDDDDSQNEDDDGDLLTSIAPSRPSGDATANANRNVLVFAKQFATHKRLRPTQISEVETFAADPIATRQIKMYTVMLAIEGRLEAMRTATADFKVSASLNKNLQRLALGILVSPQLAAYKGSIPTKILMDILKKRRFDLPVGIEFIASDWATVKSRAEYQLTQLVASIKDADPKKHKNIFALGQRFVRDTDTTLTTPLCARIALMRKYYTLYPGDIFWDKLDIRLAWMRENSKGDAAKQTKMFKVILNDDRDAHGIRADYTMPDDAVVDEWQAEVDTVVDHDNTALA